MHGLHGQYLDIPHHKTSLEKHQSGEGDIIKMTTKEKKELFPYVLWFNLLIGFYNLYLYVNGGTWWFNLLIGSLNIGVWVFNRKSIFK